MPDIGHSVSHYRIIERLGGVGGVIGLIALLTRGQNPAGRDYDAGFGNRRQVILRALTEQIRKQGRSMEKIP